MKQNKYAENLKQNCGFQRVVKRGLSNYPYREHLQDCDICQGAEEIKHLEAENQQHRDIRADMELILVLISEKIGVAQEPHQTWQERLIKRIDDLVEIGDGL